MYEREYTQARKCVLSILRPTRKEFSWYLYECVGRLHFVLFAFYFSVDYEGTVIHGRLFYENTICVLKHQKFVSRKYGSIDHLIFFDLFFCMVKRGPGFYFAPGLRREQKGVPTYLKRSAATPRTVSTLSALFYRQNRIQLGQ